MPCNKGLDQKLQEADEKNYARCNIFIIFEKMNLSKFENYAIKTIPEHFSEEYLSLQNYFSPSEIISLLYSTNGSDRNVPEKVERNYAMCNIF